MKIIILCYLISQTSLQAQGLANIFSRIRFTPWYSNPNFEKKSQTNSKKKKHPKSSPVSPPPTNNNQQNNNNNNNMVQIHSLAILKSDPTAKKSLILSSHIESGSWFTYFYMDTLTEFVTFFSRLLCDRTKPGLRQQVEGEKGMIGYVHKRMDGLCAVLITDTDYPLRVAFDIVRKVLYDFGDYVDNNNINMTSLSKDQSVSSFNSKLKELVSKCQDPTKVDSMMKLKKDLESTKEVLHVALEKLLERGESIDSLVAQTEDLSDSGKEFYRRARQTACPCTIL